MGCARDVLTQLEHEQLLERDPPRVDNSRGYRLEIRKREAVEPSPKQGPTHRSELEEILTTATSIYQRHLRE